MRPCLRCTPTASTRARYGVPRSHYSLRPDTRDSVPTSFAGFARHTAHPRATVDFDCGAQYSSEGRVVATGYPYGNRYISVVTIKDRKVTQWRDYLDPLRAFAALDDRPFEPNAPA